MQDSFLCLPRLSLIFLEARRFFNFMRNSKFIEIQKYAIHLYKNKKIAPRTYVSKKLLLKNGAQIRNRTKDTGIFSPLLYLLSYLGIPHIQLFNWWAIRDLNPGPAGYEPDALTN